MEEYLAIKHLAQAHKDLQSTIQEKNSLQAQLSNTELSRQDRERLQNELQSKNVSRQNHAVTFKNLRNELMGSRYIAVRDKTDVDTVVSLLNKKGYHGRVIPAEGLRFNEVVDLRSYIRTVDGVEFAGW